MYGFNLSVTRTPPPPHSFTRAASTQALSENEPSSDWLGGSREWRTVAGIRDKWNNGMRGKTQIQRQQEPRGIHWTVTGLPIGPGLQVPSQFYWSLQAQLDLPDIWVSCCLLDVSFALIALLFYACLPCQTECYTVLGTLLPAASWAPLKQAPNDVCRVNKLFLTGI